MTMQPIDTGGEFLPVGLLDSPSSSPQKGGLGPFARDALAASHDAELFGSLDTTDSSNDAMSSLTSSTSALLPPHTASLLSAPSGTPVSLLRLASPVLIFSLSRSLAISLLLCLTLQPIQC
jgi:hypothetical protein